MGIIEDRVFVDDVLDRAAEQFTDGNLYSDDGIPTGRYDRYSNEYVRYVYEAADNIGRKDVMAKLEPSLKAQMHNGGPAVPGWLRISMGQEFGCHQLYRYHRDRRFSVAVSAVPPRTTAATCQCLLQRLDVAHA